jgi:protein ImuB
MLWLALHFPRLPLEVFSRGYVRDEGPRAICQSSGNRTHVLICNAPAAALGIRPGMPLRAACALVDKLKLYPRDEVLEQEALKQIAAWSTRFTSLVSLAIPQAILLEVAGSLSLFGSLEHLVNQVHQGLDELGYKAVLAVAPTPLAAAWLARAGQEETVEHRTQLATALADIPLCCLRLNDKQLRSLSGMGLQNVADLVRLPRDGLTRRLGKELVLLLDRALARAPDPQKPYVPPPRFRSRLLLPAEADNVEALSFAMRRMLTELGGVLLGCGGGIQELSIQLIHREQQVSRDETDVTHIDLKLAALSRDMDHLMAVLRERLERVTLEAPVIEVVMVADTILPLGSLHEDLFTKQGEGEHDWQSLLERLRARLGKDAVHGLKQVAEHRPERAWCYGSVGTAGVDLSFGRRPLWLLAEPVPLNTNRQGRPHFHGSLQIDFDRERIESGWWDGNDIARDYFIARNARGLCLWVYRELRGDRRWFLHGIFA